MKPNPNLSPRAEQLMLTIDQERCIDIHPKKCLYRIETPDGVFAVLVKPPYDDFKDDPETELAQRDLSLRICEEEMPELIIPNEVFLWESTLGDVDVVRIMPWINDVIPLSEIPLTKILSDPQLCETIREVCEFSIKQLRNEGRRFDFLKGRQMSMIPQFLKPIIQVLSQINIFTGTDQNGNRMIFLDSDWFAEVEEGSPIYNHAEKTWVRSLSILAHIIKLQQLIGLSRNI